MWFDLGLGVESKNEAVARHSKREAVRQGYDGVASTHVVNSVTEATTARQILDLGEPDAEMRAALLRCSGFLRPKFMKTRALTQFTRLTLATSSIVEAGSLSMGNSFRQKFTILAIQPLTSEVFSLACTGLDVDLIVIDPSHCRFRVSTEGIRVAIQRGIYIEVYYNPVLTGNFMELGAIKELMRALPGRGLILSSGATQAEHIKDPYTVLCIATGIMGFREKDALAAISSRPEALLRHAIEARTQGIEIA